MAEIFHQPRREGVLAVSALVAGVAMAAVGIVHLALAPVHLDHALAHGVALYAMGVVDVVWTSVWLQRRSRLTASAGIALAAASLCLYALTRVLPIPFEGEPEPVDGFGLAAQLCEGVAFASLGAFALMSGMSTRRLTAVIGSGLAGACVLLAAASYASLGSGNGP